MVLCFNEYIRYLRIDSFSHPSIHIAHNFLKKKRGIECGYRYRGYDQVTLTEIDTNDPRPYGRERSPRSFGRNIGRISVTEREQKL